MSNMLCFESKNGACKQDVDCDNIKLTVEIKICIDCEDGPCKKEKYAELVCRNFNPTQTLQLKPNKDKFDEIFICFECDRNKPCIVRDNINPCDRYSMTVQPITYKKVKTVELDKNNFNNEITCPACSEMSLDKFDNFCSNCGTKIIWK